MFQSRATLRALSAEASHTHLIFAPGMDVSAGKCNPSTMPPQPIKPISNSRSLFLFSAAICHSSGFHLF
jgi:hypothetical protein